VLRPPHSLIAALVAATAIVTAALAWAGWRLFDQQRAIDEQRSRERLENDGVQGARWSPGGGSIYLLRTDYGRAGQAGQTSWISERDLKAGVEKELFRETAPRPVGDFFVNDLSVSPDGSLLAFTVRRDAQSKSVMILPATGGEPRELLRTSGDLHIPNFTGLTWTPDGREIVFVRGAASIVGGNTRRASSELWAVALDGGKARPPGLAAEGLSKPQIHPATGQMLFQSGIRTQEIWALENLAR
jgi:WD40 repeat protein